MSYNFKKLKKELSNQLKISPLGHAVRKLRSNKVSRLKVGNSGEFLGATPDPRGGMWRATEGYVSICMEGSALHSGSTTMNLLLGVAGKSLIRLETCKLIWVVGASIDMRAWVTGRVAPS